MYAEKVAAFFLGHPFFLKKIPFFYGDSANYTNFERLYRKTIIV